MYKAKENQQTNKQRQRKTKKFFAKNTDLAKKQCRGISDEPRTMLSSLFFPQMWKETFYRLKMQLFFGASHRGLGYEFLQRCRLNERCL
uniref:Uncharacterized protein n=1 Tax=Romanomermis culicivorax TaxID=13658 RepID=A0A915KTM8_ROMCU